MKVTLPNGTTVEGTREEIADYLPPPPHYNWDGSLAVTSTVGTATAGDDRVHTVSTTGDRQ